jgi:hypothetical protein
LAFPEPNPKLSDAQPFFCGKIQILIWTSVISSGGFHGHIGGNQARREKRKEAVGQATARVDWLAVGSKSFGALCGARSNRREKARHVCGRESEDWESCQEEVGEVSSASEENSGIGPSP